MQFDAALAGFNSLHQHFGPVLNGGLLLFARMLGFVSTSPIFNRKNFPMMLKVIFAFYLTGTLLWTVHAALGTPASGQQGLDGFYLLELVMNLLVGALIGFMADMVMQAINSAGSLMTNQIGLSSAMLLDPSSGKQSMILESLFGYISTLLFIQIGGIQWLIQALKRSLETFPLFSIQMPIMKVIDVSYLIHLSGNVILIGVELVSPVIIVTMAVDLMLGIVNRTAQQMPVFQLSFALKPAIGIGVLLLTLSTFMQALIQLLTDHARIF